MPTSFNLLAGLAALLALGGCVEAYMPDVINAPNSYLVVDGFINGNGRTRIHLSRSINISTTTAPPAQKGAMVYILDDAGRRYPLTEASAGYYLSDSLLLNQARKYQLRISTSAQASYASDLLPLKVTPPLDQLKWQLNGDEVDFTFSTHDASGQTRYYRWNYAETWEFNSPYPSSIEFKNGIIVPRTTPIYTCWRTEKPSTIIQGSTASLSQDAVTDRLLLHPSARSERFKIRYSLLMQQYAETAEEFAYNEILRKNTEAVGTVNDPLPSQLTGNVHRLEDASEPVLGFVGVRTVTVQRLFISRQDLPPRVPEYFIDPYANCQAPDTAEILDKPLKGAAVYPYSHVFADPDNVPTDLIHSTNPLYPIYGYYGGARECIDCRARGSNVKPSFW